MGLCLIGVNLIMIKIQELRTYNGNNLKDFNPQSLMDKVKNGGQSLHSNRYYNGYLYSIFIDYASIIHRKGSDYNDELYNAEVVAEDKEGNQERVFSVRKTTDEEIVKELNNWKKSVVG